MGHGAPVSMRRASRFLAFLLVLLAYGVAAAAEGDDPDFDAAPFEKLGCNAADLIHHTTTNHLDFVGDADFPPAYVARDARYLYFRYRVDGSPLGSRGFKNTVGWTALMQAPTGDPFQYQFQLSLNGGDAAGDPVEIYANTAAAPIEFSPLFDDPSETPPIFSQVHDVPREGINTTPLARGRLVDDGSFFQNNADYFVEFAFPIVDLIAQGVIASPDDLADALFFPATAFRPNRYDKSFLNCRFHPMTTLVVDKTVSPALLPANATTRVAFTIVTRNDGTVPARGIRITDLALPAYMTNVAVTATSSDPGVATTVVTPNPLEVRVARLPPGATVTVTVAADARPACGEPDFINVASAAGTNADPATDSATLQVEGTGGGEVCDGIDNDCDQQVDEDGNTLCADSDLCNGTETCGGVSGCQPGPPLVCNDANVCNGAETCSPASGCQPGTPPVCDDANVCNGAETCTPVSGCQPGTPLVCDDGNFCNGAETCGPTAGCQPGTPPVCDDGDVCNGTETCAVPSGCEPGTPLVCADTDPCTADSCDPALGCRQTPLPDCRRCTTSDQCEDGDPCTTDTCAGGICQRASVPECCVPAPETCTDGADNDCDGTRDCDDTDCASAPACQGVPEACGDCDDDDGDGLVDYEDPDCCAQQQVLGVQRIVVGRSRAGNRLRLEARYAALPTPLFDPLRQDTSLQISDGAGMVFCTTIPMSSWKRPSLHVFRFRNPGQTQLAGLKDGGFSIERSGGVVFRARARRAILRDTDGRAIQVTVRVGNECARSTNTALRQARKGLVFP